MVFSEQGIGDILRRSGLGDGTTAVAMACVSPRTGVLTWSSGGLGSGAVLDSSTAMYTASVTKQLVGVLVAQQVLAGRLDPDDRVLELLPSLPRWAAPITIRHLLHHTSGLPDAARILEATGLDEQQLTNKLVLEGLETLSAPGRPAGSAFAYSNAGYLVLAVVLEAVSGTPLPTLARRSLFGPLGMTASYLAGEEEAASRTGVGLLQTVGDGGWWASAFDLLTWLNTLNSERLGTRLTWLV